ncbi:hypothetical protein C9374_006872 [Naegleria lovaniensis]|uniref:ER membrane protein complex subunit 1 n=1 Tax=Naegleria lovaniensis TaxID=51637 RepID=A0AA88H5Z4_NAELO|nr:uncharacterized protein C9374_006872 [Naegleria lovaniensis]KAG2393341.1 hypothetical protein C9374_006872 [Naegleria lovaniensis]
MNNSFVMTRHAKPMMRRSEKFRVFSMVLFLLLLAVAAMMRGDVVEAILQSEANTYDWMKENIGRVMSVESGFSNKALIVVASNMGVLAGLNVRTGELMWRRVFSEDESIENIYSAGFDKIVSLSINQSSNKRYIKLWSALDGSLIFDRVSESNFNDALAISGLLVISTGNSLFSKDLKNGAEKWKITSKDESVFTKLFYAGQQLNVVQIGSADSGKKPVVIQSVNIENGALTTQKTFQVDIDDISQLNLSANNEKVCFKTSSKISCLALNSGDIKEETISEEQAHSKLILYQNSFYFENEFGVKTTKEGQKHISSPILQLDGVSYFATVDSQDTESASVSVKKASGETVAQFKLDLSRSNHGDIQRIFLQVFKNQEANNQLIYRFIVICEDESMIGYKENQKVWTREEALASVDDIKFVEFPVHHTLKAESSAPSFVNRLLLQLDQLTEMIQKATSYVNQFLGKNNYDATKGEDESLKFVQDRLGFQKLLLVKTKIGKLFGLHSSDGHIVWSLFVPLIVKTEIDTKDVKTHLFITKEQVLKDDVKLRSEATLFIVGKSRSVALVLDALNGKQLSKTLLGFSFSNVVLIPTTTAGRVYPLLLIDEEYNVKVFPETSDVVKVVKSFPLSIHFHTRNVKEGKLYGYAWNVNETKASQTWSISLGTPIVSFASPPSLLNQHIYTGIIVTASGNVMYKYLNPGMFAVATIEKESATAEYPVLRVYIIDGTTGEILYQIHHEDASGPINMVMDENTLLYHYTNARQLRYELTSLELFNNGTEFQKKDFLSILMEKFSASKESGVFSSFGYSKPTVKKNSYIFSYGIKSIGITKTTIGVTNKQYIVSMTNDQVYLLDKKLVDARRPRNPALAPDEIAEGLMPYNPYIPYVSLNVANYGKPAHRIRLIQTSPSILESTTLMLSSGLDIFFTRLSPSKKFDILNEDFNHAMLILSTSGLLVLVFVARWLVNKKDLQLKWSM